MSFARSAKMQYGSLGLPAGRCKREMQIFLLWREILFVVRVKKHKDTEKCRSAGGFAYRQVQEKKKCRGHAV